MTENIKIWLKQMYEAELDDVRGTIANDNMWILGARDDEEAHMFEDNLAEHLKYEEILEGLIDNLDCLIDDLTCEYE